MEPLSFFIGVRNVPPELRLTPGSTLALKVLKVFSDQQVLLDWGGQKIRAKVDHQVSPGQVLRLKVEHMKDGLLLLKHVAAGQTQSGGPIAGWQTLLYQTIQRTGLSLKKDLELRLTKLAQENRDNPDLPELLRLAAICEDKGILVGSEAWQALGGGDSDFSSSTGQQNIPSRSREHLTGPEPDNQGVKPVEAVGLFNLLTGPGPYQWLQIPCQFSHDDSAQPVLSRFLVHKGSGQVKSWGFQSQSGFKWAIFFPDGSPNSRSLVLFGFDPPTCQHIRKALAAQGFEVLVGKWEDWDGFTQADQKWQGIDEKV